MTFPVVRDPSSSRRFPGGARLRALLLLGLLPGCGPSERVPAPEDSALARSGAALSAPIAFLLKDIQPAPASGAIVSSHPRVVGELGGALYFVADDGVHGRELWRSDGTQAGTVLVKDLRPGPEGGPSNRPAVRSGTHLFFIADDGVHGGELWKSDGTEAGTVLVKDLHPGPTGASIEFLTEMRGALYFRANDGVHGGELWKSDGTEAGTVLVKDIYSAPSRPDLVLGSEPGNLVEVEGTLFFSAFSSPSSWELWKSDGTEAGTVLVKDIAPGAGASDPSSLTRVGRELYFVADDGTHGAELWKSDGTEAGTVLVKDLTPGRVSSRPYALWEARLEVPRLHFTAEEGSGGRRTWRSDGTEAGTLRLEDASGVPGNTHPRLHAQLGTGTYFTSGTGALWRTDGTPGGTTLVRDFDPSGITSELVVPPDTGLMLFTTEARPPTSATLWRSDGTPEGTRPFPGQDDRLYQLSPLGRAGELLLWSGVHADTGVELWATRQADLMDRQPPRITCPGDVVTSVPPSWESLPVKYPEATAQDERTAAPTIRYSHPSGSDFPVGTTPVEVTAVDTSGNEARCTFSVIIHARPGEPTNTPRGCSASAGPASLLGLLLLGGMRRGRRGPRRGER